ncbi:hypothetical protein POTOM_053821 [Populus tomentosa]|uniref:Secreted protein n=1 Tax=Populus tomentosa TaxID=118781 RepID=A0A8X8C6H8_POPTO|nr:hypothetical protein POTOM_053821 [Populus tomentosa]
MLLQLILVFVIFSGFLENGNAGIMSAFIRSEWPSIDIPLDNEVFAVPKDHNAPQQVSNWNILCLKDMWYLRVLTLHSGGECQRARLDDH